VDRARAGGIKLTGEGGLLQQLTKKILESALEGEITDHLGHEKRVKTSSGDTRNGTLWSRCWSCRVSVVSL
jgi:transposase-like protein